MSRVGSVRIVVALGATTPSLATATDPALAEAFGMLVLLVLVGISIVLGLIGYWLGLPKRYKPLFAVAGVLSPLAVIVVFLLYHQYQQAKERSATIEANKAVIRVAQARIDATCPGMLAREMRTVDLQRALQLRVIPHWPPLNVPPGAMDWPLPMDKVTLAFDASDQDWLRKLRFEQSYFERHLVLSSEQLDYIELPARDGKLYAKGRSAYWDALLPNLDAETRQGLIRSGSSGSADDYSRRYITYELRRSLARHALEITDVSTHEDRIHWTARLRVRVIDLASADELFAIERLLPILIDSLGRLSGGVRLCDRRGNALMATDRHFDWLGYLAREVSTDPKN